MAEWVRETLALDRVLWVPVADQPLKLGQDIIAVEHRVEMVRLAVEGNPGFDISLVDVERSGPHYSVDMLEILLRRNPEANLTFILGGDSLRDLPRWHCPEKLPALAKLAVIERPGASYNLQHLEREIPGLSRSVQPVPMPQLDISSTEIRHRCAAGQSFRYLVVPSVLEYINVHHLYQEDPE
jgi:nicotinate-nucleotide adenylyltransferase